MNPTDKQNALILETGYLVKHREQPTFIAAEAGPGSGKTFTIVESLILASKSLMPNEKILVLAFNSKMKEDLQKKIDFADVNPEHFDIRTVHSVFFRQSKNFEKGEDAFCLDFSKGIFTEGMVKTALSSMCIDGDMVHPEVEYLLTKGRVFNKSILSDSNIRLLTYYVNAYFSTASKLSQTEKLTAAAKFYAKSDIDINMLHLPQDAIDILENGKRDVLPEKAKLRSNAELLLSLLLHRIGTLAKMTTPKEIEKISIPVDIVHVPSGKVTGHSSMIQNRIKKGTAYEHIYKVPHNYYYKSFYAKAMKDPSFLADTFASYGAIYVDEAQDNDFMFFNVLRLALEQGFVKVCVAVGDSDQSIYGFKSPDHFNMLKAASMLPQNSNIRVKRFDLDETFRFGSGIAGFISEVFTTKKIIGAGKTMGGIFQHTLDIDALANFLRGSEGTKTAIVCRTNAEATALALELKKLPQGSGLLKLHKSLREDLKKLYGGGEQHEDDQQQEEVSSTKRFNTAEIRKHLLSSERISSTNIILSAHQSKGDEFDYVIVASDFFRNDNFNDSPVLTSALSFLDEAPSEPVSHEEFFTRLNDPQMLEERNTLYVALTRAKKGMLFMEGNLAEALLPIAKKHAIDEAVLAEMQTFVNTRADDTPAMKPKKGFKETFPSLFASGV